MHLYDGRMYHNCKVLFREPELDVALVKIDADIDLLPYFDFAAEAKKGPGAAGDWVLAFSNCFQIATRDEPMSVQKGVIAALAELRGRRGVFDAPYIGESYFIDIVANNPGAAGGVITNRKGDLLGILGRELKNTLTDTWINYAVPITAKADIEREGKKVTVDMATFVKEAMEGKYREGTRPKSGDTRSGYHGIVLVHDAVKSATPAFIEEVLPDSPAAKAGLRPDDLIVYIDGELVATIKAFRDIMKQIPPGGEVRLEVQRGNRLNTIRLKLEEQPKAKTASK
ncbi:MAG: PDZ domain-containing protein [Gemmataceae bacterium]